MNLRSHYTALGLAALLASTVSAQVSTWIAPGTSLTPAMDWFDPANWDNGLVPNDPAAVAALHVFTPGQMSSLFPQTGGAPPVITGSVSLAEIRILTTLPPTTTAAVPTLHIGQAGGPASSLDLFGPGFTTTGPNNLIATGVLVSNGSLTFHNQATGFFNSFTLSSGATLTFADQSSAGQSLVSFGTPGTSLIVRDNADISQVRVAGQGLIDLSGAARDLAITSINGTIDINLGANRLTFDRVPNNTIAFLNGKITGTGGLTFNSTTNSILVIGSAANDYTGDTLISSNPARVVFAGTRVNNVRVTNNSLVNIGSFATVTGRLDLTAGRLQLSDNNIPAMLTVQGDYTQGADSQLTVNTAFQPSLVVSGTATLAGRLMPLAVPASAQLGSARFLLISAGQIVGRFDSSPVGFGSSITRALSLEYTATAVTFVVTQLPFANAGTTPSQRAAGASLDANIATATGSFRAMLLQLNNSSNGVALAAALGELSPDGYGTIVEEGFAAAASHQSQLDGQLAALRRDPVGRGFTFFAGADVRHDFHEAIAGLWDSRYASSGGTTGAAWRSGAWGGGFTLMYEKSSAALDPFGSRVDATGLAPGFFVQHAAGGFFQNASVARFTNHFTLRRRVLLPGGIDQTVTAAPSGSRTDYAFNAGYTWSRGRWALAPQAGLQGSTWRVDDFAETSTVGAALTFRNWSVNSLRSRVGLQADYLSAGRRLELRAGVTWLHELESDRAIPARFTAATIGFVSPGRPAETDVVQARLSLDFKLGRAASLYAGVGGAWGRNSRTASDLSAGFRWQF